MGDGPGLELLFRELARAARRNRRQARTRAPKARAPTWRSVDRVARYAEPRWFLNQFNCSLRTGLCDSDADYLVEQAMAESIRSRAPPCSPKPEAALTLSNVYVPFGSPLRFSLGAQRRRNLRRQSVGVPSLAALAVIPR
jgi:oligopeptide transport system substrate-binding protein